MWFLKCACGSTLYVQWGAAWLAEYDSALRSIAAEQGWEIKAERLEVLTEGVCAKCRAGEKVVEVVATVAEVRDVNPV